MELEDIHEPVFERLQRPSYVEPDQLELTLHDVMQRLDVAHEECHWIMALLAGVIQHLRMDHPPFPQAGPTVPQHA